VGVWGFQENDLNEYLSAPHTRIGLIRLLPLFGVMRVSETRVPEP
jgi:hypothetical protein